MSSLTAKNKVGSDLTEGNIFITLIKFSIPLLLANVIQQAYNTVDLIVIGRFAGAVGTVGTSTGGEIANFLSMLGIGFAAAGQVYVAQLAGAKDEERTKQAIGTLMTIMLAASVVLGVVCTCFTGWFLNLLKTPAEAMSEARNYMIVTCLGIPFVYGYNAVTSVLRGMGESKRPLLFVTIAAISNIILDVIFVAWFHMASLGTALATVIAQAFSFVASAVYMYRHREQMGFDFKLSSFKLHKEPLKVILRLGIPKALQSGLINISMLYCIRQINAFGLAESATNSIGNKILRLSNLITVSVDTGAAAMIGQNLGAKKYDRAKKIVYRALVVALIVAAANIALGLTIPRTIFKFFINKDIQPEVVEKVLDYSVDFMRINCWAFFLSAFMGPYGAMITGDGNANLSFLIGIIDGVVLRIGISVVLAQVFHMGVYGYFYGNALARIAPVVIDMAYFYSNHWRRRKLLTEQ